MTQRFVLFNESTAFSSRREFLKVKLNKNTLIKHNDYLLWPSAKLYLKNLFH